MDKMTFAPKRAQGRKAIGSDLVVRFRKWKNSAGILEFSISSDANSKFRHDMSDRIRPEYDPHEKTWTLVGVQGTKVHDGYMVTPNKSMIKTRCPGFTLRASCTEKEAFIILGESGRAEYALLDAKNGSGIFGLMD